MAAGGSVGVGNGLSVGVGRMVGAAAMAAMVETAVGNVLGAVGKGVGKGGLSLPPQAANSRISNPKRRVFTRMERIIPQKKWGSSTNSV